MAKNETETLDPKTTRRDAERVVTGIESCKQTITTIRGGLRQEMPALMRELEEAEVSLPKLQEEAKVALRRLGPGVHEVVGHTVSIGSAPVKVECDVEGLVDRAMDLGDVQDLLDAGVLKYDVVPHQIGRLSGKKKAIYETYLKSKEGTSAVTLPAELK